MRHFKPIVSAAISVATSAAGLFLTGAGCYHSLSPAQELSPSNVPDKLDSRLLQQIRELEINGKADEKLDVLVRTVSEINPDQEALLKKKGVIINSKLGGILSADIPAGSVRDVAAFEFVLRIELAKKLKKREDQR